MNVGGGAGWKGETIYGLTIPGERSVLHNLLGFMFDPNFIYNGSMCDYRKNKQVFLWSDHFTYQSKVQLKKVSYS